ncbi:hypothetical protein [Novosphingobium aquae]|uniref:Lipoprotein n=1 Tax=Novosphingobium aquae TaxID=3133435 RepID=A0ABU8S827_9SPHN
MQTRSLAIALLPVLLATCACGPSETKEEAALAASTNTPPGSPGDPAASTAPQPSAPPSGPPADHIGPEPSATPTVPDPAAVALTLHEWRLSKAAKLCGPLTFKQTGDQSARVRRADFSGGWGVAYDTPEIRSAYGVAGPGVLGTDSLGPARQRVRLARQWPHLRELDQFPHPSFAGYGVEGASAYPKDNPEGRGLNSVAYVRVHGQTCTYNVWSRLGRTHLEFLLENLVLIDT